MQTTGNLGLKKPEGTDVVDIADLNGNADILDTAVSSKVDKVAGKQLSTEDYTTAEKTKLSGVAAGANNYVHPANHPASIITQDASNRFVTDTEKAAWNGKAVTASPAFTGVPTAPTAALAINNDQLATTAFVKNAGTALGVARRSYVYNQLIGVTSETTVNTYTTPSAGNFLVGTYLRLTGTTTVTLKVTYNDPGGAQTTFLLNAQSTPVGSYSLLPCYINTSAGTTITVKATASIANNMFVSSTILEV
ncbi:hypothetical protein [Bacillus sp. FJAT-26390]|uniref:hypothetical protein n=1 Tax=Bacillus sp. FJAT-26390 TaxID=1743142 RepID=UPI000807BAE7|nr:hypothetical protein [Bacillus sp. FJAT-26390]OBZ08592.1 hypothetical protein A7975_26280 [Bacillus sp. FJAT-26390]